MKLLRFYINLFIILAFEVGLVDVVDRIIENMLYKMKEGIFEGNLEKNVKKEILRGNNYKKMEKVENNGGYKIYNIVIGIFNMFG